MPQPKNRPAEIRITILGELLNAKNNTLRWMMIRQQIFKKFAVNTDQEHPYKEKAINETLSRVLKNLLSERLINVQGPPKARDYYIPSISIAKVQTIVSDHEAFQDISSLLNYAKDANEVRELNSFLVSEPPYKLLTMSDVVLTSEGKMLTRIMPIVKTRYILNKLSGEKAPKEVLDLGDKILKGESTVFENLKFYYYPIDEASAGYWFSIDFRRKEKKEKAYLDLIAAKDFDYSKILVKRYKELLNLKLSDYNLP